MPAVDLLPAEGGTRLPICDRCGHPATRSFGVERLCLDCIEILLAPIRRRVAERDGHRGFGERAGLSRPEHGPGVCDLGCCTCGAAWVGRPGEPCPWCARRHALQVEHQADLVLTAPGRESGDERRPVVLAAWAERLERAVEAGIVTVHQAERARRRVGLDERE